MLFCFTCWEDLSWGLELVLMFIRPEDVLTPPPRVALKFGLTELVNLFELYLFCITRVVWSFAVITAIFGVFLVENFSCFLSERSVRELMLRKCRF